MTESAENTALRQLRSKRMSLVAARPELIEMGIGGRERLAAALGVEVPETWPPRLYGQEVMHYSLRNRDRTEEQGWSFWYLISLEEPQKLIGICDFKGRPDRAGSVEIGYSILEAWQGRGFATEAVGRLVGWAFSHHYVREVCAETLPHLRQSIRVLEKNGFKLTGAGSEAGVVRYAIQRSSLF